MGALSGRERSDGSWKRSRVGVHNRTRGGANRNGPIQNSPEGAVEVVDQVVDVLEADGEAQQALGCG